MAQFTLLWNIAPLSGNPNVIGQRASYRQKSVGGSWVTSGFSPANDLSISATTTTSPVLAENILWEFKTETLCTSGGPTPNDDGIKEGLKFQCLTGTNSHTTSSVTNVIDVTGLDITKARYTLIRNSDSAVIVGPTVVLRSGSTITYLISGLPEGVTYHFEIELAATINGVEIYSSASVPSGGLGSVCTSADVTTDTSTCAAVTGLTVTPV